MTLIVRKPLRRAGILGLILGPLLIGLFVFSSTGLATTVPLTPTPGGSGGGNPGSEVTTELPPPDLPTTNEQGYTFDLKVSLKADLDSIAREAPVYELRRSDATIDEAKDLAAKLQINADVVDRGDSTFEADGDGQLFVSSELIQYFSPSKADDGELPEDGDVVAFAKEWLRTSGLMPADLGDGKVVNRIDETKRAIVVFGPAEPDSV